MPLKIIISILLFHFFALPAYAAFPASAPKEVAAKKQNVIQSLKQSITDKVDRPGSTDVEFKTGGLGIISFLCAVAAIGFVFIPVISFMYIPLAVAAIIFGVAGLKDSNKVFAILGLAMGIAEMLLLLLGVWALMRL